MNIPYILDNSINRKLKCREYELDLSERSHIMGILNVTPDSFSDGNKYFSVDKAVSRAVEMWEEGADIIDIGGESTRPPQVYGKTEKTLTAQEEMDRILPVIEQIVSQVNCPISVDTYKSKVAEAALATGAHMINDISGLQFDLRIKEVAAKYSVPLVIMHMKGMPQTMQINPSYEDVIQEIVQFLDEKVKEAKGAGVKDVIIDPGFGFGKTVQHNYELLRRLDEFRQLECPVLIGTSRKSFIGIPFNLSPSNRLEGTAASVSWGIGKGAHIIRVHDVKEMVRVARVTDRIIRAN